jgi:hypothetical protein
MQSSALRGTLARQEASAMDSFEQVGTRGFYRPVGQVSFEQAVDMVARAMRHARSLGCLDLVANTTQLTGFPPPSVFARYAMATQWAENTGPMLRVALVARPEVVDPQKIGVLMMQNRGGNGDVFTSEADALVWLNDRLEAGKQPGVAQRGPRES